MIEIKFRVWNTKDKKFFIQEDNQRIDLSLHYWETTKHVEFPQQYTGLKDKNGKDIYEGDVVNGKFYNDAIGVVKWLDKRCGFYIVVNDIINRNPFQSAYKLNSSSLEIIGNIYENPELI